MFLHSSTVNWTCIRIYGRADSRSWASDAQLYCHSVFRISQLQPSSSWVGASVKIAYMVSPGCSAGVWSTAQAVFSIKCSNRVGFRQSWYSRVKEVTPPSRHSHRLHTSRSTCLLVRGYPGVLSPAGAFLAVQLPGLCPLLPPWLCLLGSIAGVLNP